MMKTLPRTTGYRRDVLWSMAFIHRISGVLLACFLPLHFLLLGAALDGAAKLDSALAWTALPLVKAAEAGLVFLLAVHLLGGLRVLMIENLPWRDGHKHMVTAAIAFALALACIFFLRAA
jgi:fumarate reductase subunit D